MMKGFKKWRFFALLTVLTVFLSACGERDLSALTPAGQVGRDQHNLLLLSTSIMALVIIVVVIIYVMAIAKFRRKKGEDVMPKQVEGSLKLEVIWTVIPIFLLLILAVPTVYYTYKLADTSGMEVAADSEKRADVVTVNVTAKLYWWEFEYPNQEIVTSQELVVPVGQKVYFNLIAGDVKHSFWVPSAGGKMDTNVENVNKFYLHFDKESDDLKDGVFYGKCAELCGPSHALMDFKVKTVSQDDFNTWVDGMKATADRKTTDSVALQGEEIFKQSCISCHATSGAGEGTGIAPNLAAFGDRNRIAGVMDHTEKDLKKWIENPQKYKPGNTMPQPKKINGGKDFTEEELTALSAYLMSLKVGE